MEKTYSENSMLLFAQYLVKEFKTAFDTVLYGSMITGFVLNVKALWQGLTINEFFTIGISSIALITGTLKAMSIWADRQKAKAETKKTNLEIEALEAAKKKRNASWGKTN